MRTLLHCIGFLFVVTLPATVGAQPAARVARVEGIAYDSLAKRALRNAFIAVTGFP